MSSPYETSSPYNNQDSTAKATATGAVQTGTYGYERAKDGLGQAQAGAQPYVDQAKGLASNALNTAGTYVAVGQQKLSSATQSASDPNTNSGSTTYVDQAKGVAAGAYDTASGLASSAATTAQSYVNAAQDRLSGASQQASGAADDFQARAGAHTDAAALEGQQDVAEKRAAAGTYIEQAKNLAGSALGTAQGLVAAGQNSLGNYHAQHPPNEATTLGSVLSTAHSAAAVTLETTKNLLVSAQNTLQPNAEAAHERADAAISNAHENAATTTGYGRAAQEVAQPHVDAARETASSYVGAAADSAAPYYDAAKEKASTVTQSGDNKTASGDNTYTV